MGARKIPIGKRSVTGKHAMGGAAYESSLERDLITLFQFDRNVEKIVTQPVTINYDFEGKPRRYTPDILVQYRPEARPEKGIKALLCEVKYHDELKEKFHDLRPKFKAAVRYAKSQGWRFKLFTDKQIRTPYLFNARFLLQYRELDAGPQVIERVLTKLSEVEEADPNMLLSSLASDKWERAGLIPVIWHLISNFRVGADLNQPLTMASKIWKLP